MKKKIIKTTLQLLLTIILISITFYCKEYYKNGSYLVGQNGLMLSYKPDTNLIHTFKKVDRITIDDGIEILIAPCKNNMKVRVSEFEKGEDGIPTQLVDYYNKRLNKDNAVIIKINKKNSKMIEVSGQKVRKAIWSDIPFDRLEINKTIYFRFDN